MRARAVLHALATQRAERDQRSITAAADDHLMLCKRCERRDAAARVARRIGSERRYDDALQRADERRVSSDGVVVVVVVVIAGVGAADGVCVISTRRRRAILFEIDRNANIALEAAQFDDDAGKCWSVDGPLCQQRDTSDA